jgi:hypothetical protein
MGFTQIEGQDYFDTFASVMVTKTFRVLLAIWNNIPTLKFEHFDIKTAFVNAPIDETIYVRQPRGFERKGHETDILKLKKALYGTKQAANCWQRYLRGILSVSAPKHTLKTSVCTFLNTTTTAYDDLFCLYTPGGREKIVNTLKSKMTVEEKGELSFALDTRIQRDTTRGLLKLSQVEYTKNLLKEYNITNTKDTPSPLRQIEESDLPKTNEDKKKAEELPIRNLIGRLWWLALISRPDIYSAVHKCACWQNTPSQQFYKHLIHILHYLNATQRYYFSKRGS